MYGYCWEKIDIGHHWGLVNLSFSEHFAMNFLNTLQKAHLKGQD